MGGLPTSRPVSIVKEAWRRGKVHAIGDAAAGVAYWWFFALFPALLAFVALLGSLGSIIGQTNADKVESEVLQRLDDALAGSALDSVRSIVTDIFNQPRGGIFTVSLLAALWSTGTGFAGLSRALARVHDQPQARLGIKARLIGTGLGVVTVLIVLVACLQLVLGPFFGAQNKLPGAGRLLADVWGIIRFPVLIAIAIAWIAALLKWGPGRPERWRAFLPAAAVSVVWAGLVLGATTVFVDLGLLGGNPLLGVIGGVLVVLLVLRFLALGMLLAGEISAVVLDHPDVSTAAKADLSTPDAAVSG